MGLKYKNSNGKWVPVPIPSEINDTATSNTTTYSSSKIEDLVSNKQDKLSTEQLENISAVSNKIDNSQVGNGLKFADGMLQLDIPIATASTTYGGDTQ